jgi:hypothetical protein
MALCRQTASGCMRTKEGEWRTKTIPRIDVLSSTNITTAATCSGTTGQVSSKVAILAES